MIRNNIIKAIAKIISIVEFFSRSTEMKLFVLERSVTIRKILPKMSEVNVITLTSPSVWPSSIEKK